MNHLPHLVCEFLPIANEITREVIRHDFGAFLVEDGNDRRGIRASLGVLMLSHIRKRFGDTIELSAYAWFNLFGPFDLAGCAGH